MFGKGSTGLNSVEQKHNVAPVALQNYPNVTYLAEDYFRELNNPKNPLDKMLNSQNVAVFSVGIMAIAATAPIVGMYEEIKSRLK